MVVVNKNYIRNNPLMETDTIIIVPTYSGHLLFLKYALQRLKETGKYVICSYDKRPETPYIDVLEIPNSWTYIHRIYGAEKRLTWLWHLIYCVGLVSFHDNIRYVVTVNGDCVFDKPNGMNDLIELMGNHDIMSASSEPNLIHTCCVIWKRNCFLDFVKYIQSKLKVNKPEGYSPEVLLRDFIQKSKYKNKAVSKQPLYPIGHRYEGKVDHYSSYGQNSTFKELIGYRNLGAEHKQICLEHLEPLKKEYLDLRGNGKYFSKHEQLLYNYYINNDRRWIYKYFAEGESSDFNRRYYPLEYYGKEKITDDSKRIELGPPSERLNHFDRFKCDSYILRDEEFYIKWKDNIIKRGYYNE